MADNIQGQGGISALPSKAEKVTPKLRRLGRKAIDSIRISVGKETKSGVAEANTLERSVTHAAEKKNKLSILEGFGRTDHERAPEQTRRKMAALGSEKHLSEFQKDAGRFGNESSTSSNLKTAVGKRLARRGGMAVSMEDAASVAKKINRKGIAVSEDYAKELRAALDRQSGNLNRTPTAESWNSTASTLGKTPIRGIYPIKSVEKGDLKTVDIPAREDRSRGRVLGR